MSFAKWSSSLDKELLGICPGEERFSAVLTCAKTVLQEGLTRAKTVSSSFCTRLRVPPLVGKSVGILAP